MATNGDFAVRGARAQSMFRDVNESVKRINEAFSVVVPLGDWICECAQQQCSVRISLTTDEYESIRSVPNRFAIAADKTHFFPEIEDVVEENERFWIVEKTGQAAELAAAVDPRSS
jgi:hypothetical protein